ncbi:MAG: type II toxin-antitoxin system death-on-curing family toxin [Brachymonas sp.]|nr:type II toxin-antitoxin system death-on-curing family toxin [Brachymonas sp.]
MKDWIWLHREVMLAVHDEQLAEHGGQFGVRDMALFDSALARPQQVAAYGEPTVARLAASYGYGIARNHPFLDGNKRTAFVAVELFLMLNDYRLAADDASCVLTMLDVAAGEIGEEEFVTWIEAHLAPLQSD